MVLIGKFGRGIGRQCDKARAKQESVNSKTRIAVVIPSLGRPAIVGETVRRFLKQTRPPEKIFVCITTPEDSPSFEGEPLVEVIMSPKGLTTQRNMGLDQVNGDADIIGFFDDDFVPAPNYVEQLEAFLQINPDVAGLTGKVLRDGVKGLGLSFEEADEAIRSYATPPVDKCEIKPQQSLYGCNMIFRREAIAGLRFDETLPLYGWLEDVDFSRQAKSWGPLVRSNALAGVHLGSKGGRISGLRFGYSQIVNPIYLHRKGTMSLGHAADNMGRNFVSNHARVLYPEPHIDRWGRVKGNWLAIFDVVRGRINPMRVLSL